MIYQESLLEDQTHGTSRKVGRIIAKSVGQVPLTPLIGCHKTEQSEQQSRDL